jgi:hypothetical protein
VAAAAIAPGFVVTEFGPGAAAMAKWGGSPVDQAVRGILAALGDLSMATTGAFVMVPSDGSAPKPMPW